MTGTAAAGRWSCSRVDYGSAGAPADLVRPAPLEAVFTRLERLRSGAGASLASWAGRLAAKHAVIEALGYDRAPGPLSEVEILPATPPGCRRGQACPHGHPPAVRFGGKLAERAAGAGIARIQVSVSHTSHVALAVALVTRTPNGG
ncbi:phosphopantetheinyl transferase [Nonomuraea sp. K274]|uniref:Phosphopantetheinyl transferase n=1 Tax=Nonomuraea cypriaca TaxID=1187855 RepID=A0A931A630_9ACTN|nr:phosphopantetheinyl transferase [Nonomuraea cypriaca]MBF8186916.1 phosphopantetheinyl transferase [Nonomuraea cypriaca]